MGNILYTDTDYIRIREPRFRNVGTNTIDSINGSDTVEEVIVEQTIPHPSVDPRKAYREYFIEVPSLPQPPRNEERQRPIIIEMDASEVTDRFMIAMSRVLFVVAIVYYAYTGPITKWILHPEIEKPLSWAEFLWQYLPF